MNSDLLTSFGRMFPDCSLADLAAISSPSSLPWTNSGILGRGRLLTLATSECPSAGAGFSACSLASILEPHAAPKYLLSANACRGVLRRAARRGRTLPEQLRAALTRAASTDETQKRATSSPTP